jgi:hypothetical protein
LFRPEPETTPWASPGGVHGQTLPGPEESDEQGYSQSFAASEPQHFEKGGYVGKNAKDGDADISMPTKEEIMSQPEPQPLPLTPTQEFTERLLGMQRGLNATTYGLGLAELLRGANPGAWLANLGVWPVELHKATGALGRTGAEPYGLEDINLGPAETKDLRTYEKGSELEENRMYNLGIRSPGERPITRRSRKPVQQQSPPPAPAPNDQD